MIDIDFRDVKNKEEIADGWNLILALKVVRVTGEAGPHTLTGSLFTCCVAEDSGGLLTCLLLPSGGIRGACYYACL